MKIAATQYTLGYRSFEIYISGCGARKKCVGCHNPTLWNFNFGDEYTEEYFNNIKDKVQEFGSLIDNVFIMGGEPLDQNIPELHRLICDLKSLNKSVWLFTRKELSEVIGFIRDECDYIKTGIYDETFKTDNNVQFGIKLATSNQHIYKKGIDY